MSEKKNDNNEYWQNQAWEQPKPPSQEEQAQSWQAPQPKEAPTTSSAPVGQAPMPVNSFQQVPPPPPQKKGKGWIVALVAVILIFLLLAIGVVSCSSAFSSSATSSLFGTAMDDSMDVITEDSVGVITIDGTIQYDGTTSSPEGLKKQLDRAEENPRIKAVVLRVNSGGGTATAGEEMSVYLRDFSKPVVVSSASINASAAYMISSQSDYIYTARTTAIGSIGTALQITDLSGLYEKLGINIENITSSDSKDSGYGTRSLNEEERAYYQDMVNQINEAFLEIVAEGRAMDIKQVRELATGMTFTGTDAVKNGLADEIGTLDDACEKAAELAGISSYQTVALQSRSSSDIWELLDILGYSAGSEESLESAIRKLEEHGSLAQ